MSSNKFKAVPLALFVLLSALVLCLWQGLFGDFHEYVIFFEDDNFGKHGGWALYALLIPAAAGLCAYPRVRNLFFYLGSLVVPLLLCISYWLWELLGWVFMFCAICGIYSFIVQTIESDDRLDSAYLYMGLGYIVARIISSFISESLRNIVDICYVALLSLTQLYFIFRTYFSNPHVDSFPNLGFEKESYYSNSTGFYNGIFIIVLMVVLVCGALGWKKATSLTVLPEDVTIEETTSSNDSSKPSVQQPAKSDNKHSSSNSSSGSSQGSTKPPKTTPPEAPKPKLKPEPAPASPKVHPFQGYKTSADAGDAAAMYKTAKCYQQGDGVGKSLSSAFNYMYQAAQAGYVPAYFEVAEMFHGGRGTQKNRDTAEFWYKKAADNGNAKAKQILNNM